MGKNNGTVEHLNKELNKISSSEKLPTVTDVTEKLALDNLIAYIEDDTYTGDPEDLLGKIIMVSKRSDGKCPDDLNEPGAKVKFCPTQIVNFEVNEKTRLKQPVQRGSLIVNKNLSGSISFLNFLSAQMDGKDTFSLIVTDQATGRINMKTDTWKEALDKWISENQEIMNNPDVCYLFVVTGFVQKNILKKKYTEFSGGAKGGGYGINLEGKLFLSSEAFTLDIRFGLSPAVIKRPKDAQLMGMVPLKDPFELTEHESTLFSSIKLPKVTQEESAVIRENVLV